MAGGCNPDDRMSGPIYCAGFTDKIKDSRFSGKAQILAILVPINFEMFGCKTDNLNR